MSDIEILLIEDNEGDIFLITEALEESNLSKRLSVVMDGKEAIDFLNKEGNYSTSSKPDLILLDVNLPRKNGHEVLQFIKGNESLKQTPVIMLSTSSSSYDINLAYRHYANSYITKPDGNSSFHEIIQDIENFWIKLARLPIYS